MSGDLLSRMLAALRRHARADAVCLWAAVPGTGTLHLFASDPPDLPLGEKLPTAAGLLLETCSEGALRWVTEPAARDDFEHPPLMMDRLRPRAVALIPVGSSGEGAAAVAVVYLSAPPGDPGPLLFEWARWAGLLDVFLPGGGREGAAVVAGVEGGPAAAEEAEEGLQAAGRVETARLPTPREEAEEEAATTASRPPDHALQQAAAGLARRVRERLASVLPSLQQAGDELDSDHPADRFLRYALEGMDRTSEFLTRVLAFADDGPLMVETVSMTDCVAEAIRTAPTGESQGVKVRGVLPQGLPLVLADRVQVVAAVSEIVRNAVEAAPGGTEVVVELEEAEGGIRVTVADEGVGMDAATVRRAVRPFFSTKRPDRHAGLGLAAARGIVHRHGGELFISSRPGAGTRVRLRFPLQASPPSGD